MNRSVLIVICDFLLVSLLAFSSVDINRVAEGGMQTMAVGSKSTGQQSTNSSSSGTERDLAGVMRAALEEERKSREQILAELSRTKATLGEQQMLLVQREGQAQALQRELEARQELARRLEQTQHRLEGQYGLSQSNIQALTGQLQEATVQSAVSQERLQAMQAELQRQVQEAAALKNRMATLEQSNQVVVADKARLATQLQVAQVQREQAAKQVQHMQQQVEIERQERAKLADNVQQLASHSENLATNVQKLASKSDDLKQEIRENRPLAANTIFFGVLTNRVHARFNAFRSGMLGLDANRKREAETIVITDGTNHFALCHVQDTPLVLTTPGSDWESLTGVLAGPARDIPIRHVSFYLRDPRIVLIPVTPDEVKQLGVQAYRSAADPYKFQDAVLVGATEGYYGECRFQIDLSTPDYVKLDNSFVRGLFGKFNPNRGDLVLSRNGELLGIMANSTYCLMLRNFNIAATIRFSPDTRAQSTGRTLSQLHSVITELPPKLQ